jgi:hypothetical protein
MAARDSFEAFLVHDDDVYFASLSEACRDEGFGAISEHLNSRHGKIRFAGMSVADISIAGVQIDDFNGSTATVSLQLEGTDGNEFIEGQPHDWVYESGGWHWADCQIFVSSGGGGGSIGGESQDNPIGFGYVATIADWVVHGTYLQKNGNDAVAEGGNGPPPAGTVYYLPSISVTYDGPNASAKLSDALSFRLVAGSTVYDDASGCGPHPGALELDFVAAPGDGVPGDICRAVKIDDIDSVLLVVTEKATGTDYWFAFE